MTGKQIDYTPQTSAGRAALDAANEALATLAGQGILTHIQLPGVVEMFRPLLEPWAEDLIAHRAADVVVWIDQDPERARAALAPLLRRLAGALDLTPADVIDAQEAQA